MTLGPQVAATRQLESRVITFVNEYLDIVNI